MPLTAVEARWPASRLTWIRRGLGLYEADLVAEAGRCLLDLVGDLPDERCWAQEPNYDYANRCDDLAVGLEDRSRYAHGCRIDYALANRVALGANDAKPVDDRIWIDQ